MNISDFMTVYAARVLACVQSAHVTGASGEGLDRDKAFLDIADRFHKAHAAGGKVIMVGNGASAAMASHQAFDYWKNGKIRAMAMNDAVLLTGSGNDFGYPRVFSAPMEMFATKDDVVVAISSSGKSENILNAAREGRRTGCFVVTLSGFGTNNPLRSLGDINIYLENPTYGQVELGHETILHSLLDWIISQEKV